MSDLRPWIAGGAAAAIVAGAAAMLFPSMTDTIGTSHAEDAQFAAATRAFAHALAGDVNGSRFEELGLGAGQVDGAEDAVLLSHEQGRCTGQGIYWIRPDGGRNLAITAPHRGSDRHTGTLAAMLFLETRAQAAAWNSAPRRPTAHCPHGLDLARTADHLFSAFNTGFAEATPQGIMVQLHGFDGDWRDSLVAQNAGMIISNGTEEPSDLLLDLADCLSLSFAGQPVLVYPIDTHELGALKNAQGELLREAGFEGFVHLEISAEMRAALVEDDALRGKLARCLMETSS